MLTPAWLIRLFRLKNVFCFFVIFGLTSCDFISNKILTKPVVQVENTQLSAQEFSQELAYRLKTLDALSAKDPKILAVFKNQIVNDFIITTFVNLWFAENKLTISKEALDSEIKSYISSYPSDSAFREALAESEISYAVWVKRVEDRLKKKRLFAALNESVAPITEDELLSYYNNNKTLYEQRESILLAHIKIADENQADIVKKLLRNQSFSDVAKKYSSAYTSESEDIFGWVEKDSSPELEKAFKYRTGEVFGPISISGGLHIFKLIQRRAFKIRSFAESKAEVTAEVMALRETAKYTAWLDEQIKRYKIKKNLSMLDSIRVETQ